MQLAAPTNLNLTVLQLILKCPALFDFKCYILRDQFCVSCLRQGAISSVLTVEIKQK